MLRFGLLILILTSTLVCKASSSNCELFHDTYNVFYDIVTVIIILIPYIMYRYIDNINGNFKLKVT